ncbi:ferredoxin [Methanocaldococcus villosus KIN24-T80]|uniref:Ferredoxin n=1 Tax=Methanocaldococcus villosus KIN24-T80 TaxID=1069083 RepID=N6V147_9EURY|nr:4Fe-4S dicluster domain-containing protein [Methanocaldococcus villosus]ENN96013.1 ferredoxin [Methanocaldococcus villosus KIN24-T80]
MLSKIFNFLFKKKTTNEEKRIRIDYDKCKNCTACVRVCKNNVFVIKDGKVILANPQNCDMCYSCIKVCRYGALYIG